jgi:tetratricopeptide (TPR) repeat protein
MRRKLLILSLITALFCIGSVNVQAAPKDDPAAKLPFKKKLKWADALYKQASFYTAVDYYYQLKKEQPRNPTCTYMLAECSWMILRDYPPAAEYYAEAFALAPNYTKKLLTKKV